MQSNSELADKIMDRLVQIAASDDNLIIMEDREVQSLQDIVESMLNIGWQENEIIVHMIIVHMRHSEQSSQKACTSKEDSVKYKF